jgi:hypothetical protein
VIAEVVGEVAVVVVHAHVADLAVRRAQDRELALLLVEEETDFGVIVDEITQVQW